MGKMTQREGSSVAPFLNKCYEMVDDVTCDSIISWGPTNDSFVIWDITQFTVLLLPKYFKHSNFSSFMRQLNIYGFRKINTDRWEFASDGFIRGQKLLLKNIIRKKNVNGSDHQKALQKQETLDEKETVIENFMIWKDIENLKEDKNSLMQEFIELSQHQENTDNKLIRLSDRLEGMEQNQQQMLSFLVMAVQSPDLFVQIFQPKENKKKAWVKAEAGKMLEEVTAKDDEKLTSKGVIVKYQSPIEKVGGPVLSSPIGESGKQKESMTSLHSDMMKFLHLDAKLSSSENDELLVAGQEVHDYSAWEDLLIATPSHGKIENASMDEVGEMGFKYLKKMDESQNLEHLIEQMEKCHKFGVGSPVDGKEIITQN